MSVSNFANISSITLKSICKADAEEVQPVNFVPYNWLKTAHIYNKRWQQIPNDWIIKNADIIVLLFTAKGVDRGDILKKFYHIYESTKYVHIPIEVIFLPMDETEDDALACFKEQANWFTLRFNDVLVHTLKFMYGISCIPHLTVFNTDCEVISYNGIAELDMYGKNAVISWLSLSATSKKQRRRSQDAEFYGPMWRFAKPEEKLPKYEYRRRFKAGKEPAEGHKHFPGHKQPESQAGEPFDGHFRLPDVDAAKPSKDHLKPPEDSGVPIIVSESKPLENITVTDAVPAEGRKSSVIHIMLPEDRSVPSESRDKFPKSASKLTVTTAQPSGHSIPSESIPSESVQVSEGGIKPSKIRVQLPEVQAKQSDSQIKLPEARSKSATVQTSESNEQIPEARAKKVKSAKFAD